ncbi:hypothetical protein TM1040_1633 [Ruegeria sp. TM1040]|uniref:ParB N-terminal domain-containing protein n=1 Tax=Ruegeria sp. (strain TM1040) TaxID=292414 RepID=UPI0000462389|nr:ParB N-terminal domain-containing protein [Ruegeria sp. TM1040]ABF64366.1 hypothetical protein TM1040_1633 [Ruegeria sp. TM1040]
MTLRPIDVSEQPPVQVKAPVSEPELRWLEISDLVVNDLYQRPLGAKNWSVIRKIAIKFDWSKFTPITVAPSGEGCDRFAIIDGQHRVHAAAMRGLVRVPAMVANIAPPEQASCFAAINSARTNVSAFHLFKAGLAAGDTSARIADAAVSASGCRLMPYNKSARNREAREIYAIGLVRGYTSQKNGASIVTRALRALSGSACAEDPQLYQARILRPWFATLWDEPEMCELNLEAFVSKANLVSVRDRIGVMRERPEFAKWSDYALAAKSFKALLRQSARSGEIGSYLPSEGDEG